VPAQKKSMIGHSRVLTRDHDRLPAARIVARALLMKAASRLRHQSLFSGAMTLTLKARPGAAAHERVELTARFHATQDSHGLLRDLDRLWSQAAARLARGNAGAVRLRGVTVYLHGLCTAEAPERVQGDLFAEPAAAAQSEKRDRLWQTIDRINTDPDGRLRRLGRAPRGSTASGAGRLIDLASQRGSDVRVAVVIVPRPPRTTLVPYPAVFRERPRSAAQDHQWRKVTKSSSRKTSSRLPRSILIKSRASSSAVQFWPRRRSPSINMPMD